MHPARVMLIIATYKVRNVPFPENLIKHVIYITPFMDSTKYEGIIHIPLGEFMKKGVPIQYIPRLGPIGSELSSTVIPGRDPG